MQSQQKLRAERGRFLVEGVDEETGEPLEVPRIKWDGKSLEFSTLFRSNSHKSNHVVGILRTGKMRHHVAGVYFDGEAFSDDEVWRKRPRKPHRIKSKTIRLRDKSFHEKAG